MVIIQRDVRSIPACAGEPPPAAPTGPFVAVYPRVCGGTTGWTGAGVGVPGLSPRVRGNPHARVNVIGRLGSIPACAGEPVMDIQGRITVKVYPRVCGGTTYAGIPTPQRVGLSPRVRGNLDGVARLDVRRRSIPACAGEPHGRSGACGPKGVYPRVCGGTGAVRRRNYPFFGLSPRVRGNRHGPELLLGLAGSIPACAGEPA